MMLKLDKPRDRKKRESKPLQRHKYVVFKKVKSELNMLRYYVLFEPEQTMFENIYAVKTVYGRMNSSTHCVYKLFNSLNEANKYSKKCYVTRIKHGYEKTV
jgi:predicted DNA-binding WGR domain protein